MALSTAHKALLIKIKFWSNFLFILPLLFAIFYEINLYIPIIGLVLIISSIYHYSNERRLINTDLAFALLLIFSNFILLFHGKILSPFALSALSLAALAIYFYLRQEKHGYDLNHGLFHIFSSLISIFSILNFVLY